MSDARENILQKLQRGRRARSVPPDVYTPPRLEDRLAAFTRGLKKVFATYASVASTTNIRQEIESYLQQQNAVDKLVVTGAVRNAGFMTGSRLELVDAPTGGDEASAVAFAYAGISETGSLVLLSGPDSPVTTNFLPDNFICVLKQSDLLDSMEALWSRMKNEHRDMPRAINIVTGPSRTADVEQTIQMGAHGPRRVHVILLLNE